MRRSIVGVAAASSRKRARGAIAGTCLLSAPCRLRTNHIEEAPMRSDGRQGGLRHAQARNATTAMRMVRLALSTTAAIVSLMLLPALAGAALAAPTPINTSAPALTGTPVPGQTLTCSTGAWANNPSGYTYVWLRDGSPVPGQSASTYVVQNADSGHSISCQVTAVNVGGEYTIVGLSSG